MWTEFRQALSRSWGQILGWGLSLAVLGFYLISFYDTLAGQREQLEQLMASYPPELMAFFGDMGNMFTPAGFISIEFFSYMPLILGIFAISSGSSLLVRDEENGILDLLIAHPVGRPAFFLSRWLAFALTLALIMVVTWLGFLVGTGASESLDIGWLAMARPFFSLWALLMLFGNLALLLSMLLPSRRLASAVGGLVLVASFFLTTMARLDDRLADAAKASPLAYYQSGSAIDGLNLEWFAGLLAAGLVCVLFALWRFQRRDIRVGGEGGWSLSWLRRRQKPA